MADASTLAAITQILQEEGYTAKDVVAAMEQSEPTVDEKAVEAFEYLLTVATAPAGATTKHGQQKHFVTVPGQFWAMITVGGKPS